MVSAAADAVMGAVKVGAVKVAELRDRHERRERQERTTTRLPIKKTHSPPSLPELP